MCVCLEIQEAFLVYIVHPSDHLHIFPLLSLIREDWLGRYKGCRLFITSSVDHSFLPYCMRNMSDGYYFLKIKKKKKKKEKVSSEVLSRIFFLQQLIFISHML